MATPTKSTGKQQRRVKLRAMQKVFHKNRLIEEGEVFVFEGDQLPNEEIAAPVEVATPLGPAPETPPSKEPPLWTTQGFVDKANRDSGRDEDDDFLT